MTDITHNADNYPAGIYQIAVTDPVLGGVGGIANKAAAALADRTEYLRMRNVTPWRAGLEFAYPANAYVHWAGTTWKSLVANANVEPGTDAAKWIRWGYTSAELDAYMAGFLPYGAPPACPNTGPIGTDNKAKIYKSALGEYWMWMGDAWRVIAGRWGNHDWQMNLLPYLSGTTSLYSWVAHRSGTLHASCMATGNAPINNHYGVINIRRNAVGQALDSAWSSYEGNIFGVSAAVTLNVVEGTVIDMRFTTVPGCNAWTHSEIVYVD